MQADNGAVRRLKAVVEADLGALVRVLQCLQPLNAVPVRLSAHRVAIRNRSTEVLEIEIDMAASEIAPAALCLVAAKIDQLPGVLTTTASDR